MKCPRCGLSSPEAARSCECLYDFTDADRLRHIPDDTAKRTGFDVYRHAQTGETRAVKNGFSWPACVFAAWWEMATAPRPLGRLTFHTLLMFTCMVVNLTPLFFLSLLFALYMGANGNRWKAQYLRHYGFVLVREQLQVASIEQAISQVSSDDLPGGNDAK